MIVFKRNSHKSLLHQLLIPLVLSFVLLVLLMTGLVFVEMKTDLEHSIKKQLLSNTETIKTQLKTIFHYHILNTSAWAKLEIMDDIITEDIDGQINRSLQELKSNYHLPGDILVFDHQRQLISSSNNKLYYQTDTITPPNVWFQLDKDHTLFIGKHINPYTHQEAITFIHRITASFDSQRDLGFIVLTHPWSSIENIVLPKQIQSILIDQTGYVLASNVKELSINEFIISSLQTNRTKLTNTDFLFEATQLTHVLDIPINWQIVSLEKHEKALQPVWRLGIKITIAALTLTLMISCFIVWQIQRVVAPIQKVTQTVLEIAQSSDLSKRVAITDHNETGILADSFNLMAEKLAETMTEKDHYSTRLTELNKTLEQQVTDRTKAYSVANEQLQSTIKQLQQAQTQLIQSEKMASLGQLVAGIAHEINNPLGSINANIPILTEYTHDLFAVLDNIQDSPIMAKPLQEIDYSFIQEDTPKLLDSMKNAASRMKEIILSLRNFSRLDQAEVQDILLEDAIDTTLALLSHRLKNRITVIKHYQLNQLVPCYAGLINQVLMNLLANAEQAIEDEGQIIIETKQQNNYALISIQDTGTGMDSDTMNKIFDPFFTTKPVGEGTGMGLSISYGIIEKHNGSIKVSSKPNAGTVFTIHLPMTFKQQKEFIKNG